MFSLRKLIIILVSLLLVISLVFTLTGCGQQVQESAAENAKKVPVDISPAENRDFELKLEVTGTIAGVEEVKIFPEISGRLVNLKVKEGERAKKGDVIALLKRDVLKAKVEQAQAKLAAAKANLAKIEAGARQQEIEQAKANLNQAQLNFENARADYNRMQKLHQNEAITEQKLDDVKTKYEVAEAKLRVAEEKLDLIKAGAREEEKEMARSNLKQARAALKLAKVKLTNTIVKAPNSGIITNIFVSEGEMVSPQAPIAYSIKMEQVLLEADISSKDLSKVEVGQPVSLQVDSYPGQQFKGKVSRIGDRLNKQSRTVEVEIKLDNSDFKLKSGMFAQGQILVNTFKDKVILPPKVIKKTNGTDIVYVAKNGQAREKEIKGRLITENKYLVESGIKPGEKVITSNLNQISDGKQVRIDVEGSD